MINNGSWSIPIVLDRDFFATNNLVLVYKPLDVDANNWIQLFDEVASAEVLVNKKNKLPIEIRTDFGPETSYFKILCGRFVTLGSRRLKMIIL